MRSARNLLADALCSEPVGRALSACFGGRVPSVRFPGARIDVSSPLVPPRLAASIFFGVYESAEIRFIRRHLRRDLDVVELGSSIGVVAAQLARHVAPDRQLICVEANPDLIPLLERNVRAGSPNRAVAVHNLAIDYDSGRSEIELVFGDTNLGGSTVGRDPGGRERRRVPTTTLSRLLEEHRIAEFALVSDIQGAEAGIIEHDASALTRCRQLVMELHDPLPGRSGPSAGELMRILQERLGFQLRERHGVVGFFERPPEG